MASPGPKTGFSPFAVGLLLVAVWSGAGSWGLGAARADQASLQAGKALPPEPPRLPLTQVVQRNNYAYIPPQCYTQTKDSAGQVHNPCYTCHVNSRPPNFINDGEVQLAYDFVPGARHNHWSNLFVDWSRVGAPISNDEITRYVRESNYFDKRGDIILAGQLAKPPREWDYRSDGRWLGYVPDAYYRFDERGFDRTPAGGYTGWRAYAYYPLPGTFWATNGSIGDALVRLPEAFRQNEAGQFDARIYELNLSVVEALITRRDVPIEAVDEHSVGVDLDLDGALGLARRVRFADAPPAAERMGFVGRARREQASGQRHLAPGAFPEGTEFLHSVRYLDVGPAGVTMAARLKELRYARKSEWWTRERLEVRAIDEADEKADSPTTLRAIGGDLERGVSNAQGWWYQGFIEDADGALRPQSFEETAYCIGCHGGVGRADDGVFSFGRRFSPLTFQRGWFHWTQRGLEGVPDQIVYGGAGSEYVAYLEENGAADEFRQNAEARAKFFDARGRLKPDMVQRLRADIAQVVLPSPERALALDKAYRALVRTQRFSEGREVVLGGAEQVHHDVQLGESTGIRAPVAAGWHSTRYSPVPEP